MYNIILIRHALAKQGKSVKLFRDWCRSRVKTIQFNIPKNNNRSTTFVMTKTDMKESKNTYIIPIIRKLCVIHNFYLEIMVRTGTIKKSCDSEIQHWKMVSK